MAFSAEVEGVGFICLRVIPFEDAELGIATVDDKPAHGGRAFEAANLTLIVSPDQDSPPDTQEFA
jgi:hypothetical protein